MRQFTLYAMMAAAGTALAFSVAGCTSNQSTIAPIPGHPASAAAPAARPLDTTPTPTPTPIQLVQGGTIGTPTWPEGDTATGGQGQGIDGINCRSFLSSTYHHHAHLSIFVNGAQLAVPRGTGMKNPGTASFIYHASCFYFIHTHDTTGILHMEPPAPTAFILGNYFDVWGMTLSNTQIGQFTGTVTAYVNGMLDTTDTNVRHVPLNPGDDVTLVLNGAPDWIPAYLLPAGYP